jgi:hypothetical protein
MAGAQAARVFALRVNSWLDTVTLGKVAHDILELMSVYQDRAEDLERFEFMMGLERGRLAVTLDLLTDALVLVGQHGVYCQSARQAGKPAMDIQIISECVAGAKELIASVMEEMQRKRAAAAASEPA